MLDLEGNGIRLARIITPTLIGGQLKTTPAFINRCYLNKTTASLISG